MRIVAGRFRGHHLAPVPKRGVRPTSDPVREALFNILGPRVAGLPFVDLFAGTGAVGLEALSRGADPVVLVERDRNALRTIHRNLELLKLSPGEEVQVAPVDVGRWLDSEEAWSSLAPAKVVFLDPPYGDTRIGRWLEQLAGTGLVGPESLVVVEHGVGEPPPSTGFREVFSRRYGDSALWGGARP